MDARAAILSVVVATTACLAVDAAAAPYDEGLKAIERGDTAAARSLFQAAADNGDARAQFSLGRLDASGAPPDYAGAVLWCRKAAAQGNPGAEFELGYLYQSGRGVARDDAKALGWYLEAAEQGYSTAQINLAMIYDSGRGAPKDRDKAITWSRKAADQGDADGEYTLALLYLEAAREPIRHDVSQEDFRGLMNRVFGYGKWRETGGYRSPARENELRTQGAQTVPVGVLSRHSMGTPGAPGAYDVVVDGVAPTKVAIKLRNSGAAFRRLFAETSHGTQGAHLHVEPILSERRDERHADLAGASDAAVTEGHRPASAFPDPGDAAPQTAGEDYVEAIIWMRRAADQGNAAAQVSLRALHAEGETDADTRARPPGRL